MRSENGNYVFATGRGPTVAERSEARRLIADIRADLDEGVTASDPAIGMIVTKLHVAMQKPITPAEANAIVEVWTDGLVDVPAAAIEAAYEQFTQGATHLSRSFLPKVPEFAGLARDIAKEWALAARWLELILDRPEADGEVATLSPAGVAKLAEWRRKFGGTK